MTVVLPALDIVPVARAEILVEQQPWPFATARRAAIDRHFVESQQDDGPVERPRPPLEPL